MCIWIFRLILGTLYVFEYVRVISDRLYVFEYLGWYQVDYMYLNMLG